MAHPQDSLVIDARKLTKTYGAITAVDHLDLTIRRGEVYGFLGPNGAGKTTTLRMLLGLVQPTSGTATMMGAAPGSADGLGQTGSMIENPAFYPHLSGHENLLVLAKYTGTPVERIDRVLAEVELANRGGDAFRTYSMGMKQRLGVAAALLKDPALLILDEPTNGLDPAGMVEMRSLIRHLGTGDRTVLISSHLMSEIEQMCDRIGIISHGKMIAEGTVDELRGEDRLVINVDPIDVARSIVSTIPGIASADVSRDGLHVRMSDRGTVDPAAINTRLVREGLAVSGLRWERASLESVFLSLTGTAQASPDDPGDIQQAKTLEVTHA